MMDQNAILNDPTMTPVITEAGQCIATHDGRFVIAASSLRIRSTDATEITDSSTWLDGVEKYVAGGAITGNK